MTRLVFPSTINLISGRRSRRLHQHPACGGQGLRRTKPFSSSAFMPGYTAVRPPGSASTDQVLGIAGLGRLYRQVVFIAAPSITTPAVTYFQSATSSFRASATIAVLRWRPPLRLTRSSNHCVSAECGWCRTQSQASWISVVRSRGLPDFETPCSRSTDPLCQGVGARPA